MKNVLLLGDMSAFHSNLAKGLRNWGYHVDVASAGDGFKRYSRDIEFGPHLTKKQRIEFVKSRLNSYDIVQFISPDVLGIHATLKFFQMKILKKVKPKCFMALVGCDYNFWTKGREILNIPLFDEVERYQEKGVKNSFMDYIKAKFMERYMEAFIPCTPEYLLSNQHLKSRLKPAVMPVDVSELPFKAMDFSGCLNIYHGIQRGREGFKGSGHIVKAFEYLNKKYPNDVNCIAKGGLPYNEYVKLLDEMHVLLDQTNAISYGMNALAGLALGKLVGCNSFDTKVIDQWCACVDIEKPPIFPIHPDSNKIIHQIESLLDRRHELSMQAKQGRAYVEKFHDCKIVAKVFLKHWGCE